MVWVIIWSLVIKTYRQEEFPSPGVTKGAQNKRKKKKKVRERKREKRKKKVKKGEGKEKR